MTQVLARRCGCRSRIEAPRGRTNRLLGARMWKTSNMQQMLLPPLRRSPALAEKTGKGRANQENPKDLHEGVRLCGQVPMWRVRFSPLSFIAQLNFGPACQGQTRAPERARNPVKRLPVETTQRRNDQHKAQVLLDCCAKPALGLSQTENTESNHSFHAVAP